MAFRAARIVRRLSLLAAICWPAVTVQGQVRISRDRLSPQQRAALARGAVVKQTTTASDTVPPQANEVTLGRDQVLIARTRAPYLERVIPKADTAPGGAPVTGQDSVYGLGIEVIGVVPGTNRQVTYRPVFIRHGAAYYSAQASGYEGHFSVGVVDASGASVYELATPLIMTFGGDPETYEPPSLSVRRAGDAPSRVRLVARTARDSVSIRIFMGDDVGIPFAMPIQSALEFVSPPPKIQGFGVDLATYVIRVNGSGGPSARVGVNTTRGLLDRNEIELGQSGTGVVRLRSGGGLGSATLSAVSPNMQSASTEVQFVFPALFLIFMLAGGTAGALFADSQAKKRKGTRRGVPKVIGAILGGIIATAVYVGLGINVLRVVVSAPLASEIAVFAFAALGAAFGLKIAAGGEPAPR
jgi:hypothetical protein